MSKGLESFIRLKALLLINTKEGKLTSISDLLNDIEKELKALEIIKKYHITSAFFMFNPTYKTYEVNMSFYEDEIMSEEEYNLSKEILK